MTSAAKTDKEGERDQTEPGGPEQKPPPVEKPDVNPNPGDDDKNPGQVSPNTKPPGEDNKQTEPVTTTSSSSLVTPYFPTRYLTMLYTDSSSIPSFPQDQHMRHSTKATEPVLEALTDKDGQSSEMLSLHWKKTKYYGETGLAALAAHHPMNRKYGGQQFTGTQLNHDCGL
nr:expressed protein [Hymenolepis microstoma]